MQLREVDAIIKQEHVSTIHYIKCTCKIQWYTMCMLSLLILGIVILIFLNVRKLKLCRGHLFSNAVKIMLFILYAHYYVSVKLCRTVGSIHLFRITGTLLPVQLKRNVLWDFIEIDWKEVNMTLKGNKINLPTSVIILLRDKFKIRCIIK